MTKHNKESDFRQLLGTVLKHEHFEFQPIESLETGDGIPDAYFSGKLYDVRGWIELKRIRQSLGKPTIVEVPFRPGQRKWLVDHYKSGGVSILGLAFDDGYAFFYGSQIKKAYTNEELLSVSTSDIYGGFIAAAIGAKNEKEGKTSLGVTPRCSHNTLDMPDVSTC